MQNDDKDAGASHLQIQEVTWALTIANVIRYGILIADSTPSLMVGCRGTAIAERS